MPSDLKGLRELARQAAERETNERTRHANEIREIVEGHLSEWERAIKNMIVSRSGSRNFEFTNSNGKFEWLSESDSPRIDVPYAEIVTYVEQLKKILGEPFYAHLRFYNSGVSDDFYHDAIVIGYYDYDKKA